MPSLNGFDPYQNGATTSIAPSVLTPQAQQEYVSQKESEKENLSRRLQAAQGAFRAAQGDELTNQILSIPEANQGTIEDKKYSNPWADNLNLVVKGKASSFAKGVTDIMGGINHNASKVGLDQATAHLYKGLFDIIGDKENSQKAQELIDNPEKIKEGQTQLDEAANLGMNPNFSGVNGLDSEVNGFTRFIPQIIASKYTGALPFYLGAVGTASEQVNKLKKEGKTFDNGADELYIQGSGLVNTALMGLPIASWLSKAPSPLRESIVGKLSLEGINKLAQSGEKVTAEKLTEGLTQEAQTFSQKALKKGVNYLDTFAKDYKHTAAILGGLQTADYALKKTANEVSGKEDFDTNAGDLVDSLEHTLTKTAPLFAGVGGLRGLFGRTSDVKNQVVESLKEDKSDENANKIKSEVVQHGQETGLTPEQVDKSVQDVDVIHQAVKAIPDHFGEAKFNKAVDLITGRKELENHLGEIKASKESVDPSMADIPSPEESLIQSKIDQSNDKLKELATDHKFRYNFDEEKGAYTKQLGENGKPEEITKDRYKLEQLEKDYRKPKEIDEAISAPVIAKAEDDLEVLKKVEDKNKKYDASLKRLTEAKNDGKISENDFTDLKNRFDDVISNSPKNTQNEDQVSRDNRTSSEVDAETSEEIVEPIQTKKLDEQRTKETTVNEEVQQEAAEEPKVDVSETVVETPVEAPKTVISDKFEELVAQPKVTDKELKAQKKDMLDQLSEVESVIDRDDTESSLEAIKKLGYKTTDKGQVTFDVEGDGTFTLHVDGISDAIKEVQKQFPEKTPTPRDYKPKLSGANGKGKTTVTQVELDNMQENLDTATKSGNTKLQEVFQKELDRLNKLPIVEPKIKENGTLPKSSTGSILQHSQEGVGEKRSERGRVESIVEGTSPTESRTSKEVQGDKKETSKLQTAKEKLKEAKAKLDKLNNVNKITDDPKEKAKALFEYHKALVNVAKEYISEGIDNVKDFAKEIGEKVTKSVRTAWNEATGQEKKTIEDFEEAEVDAEDYDAEVMGITKKELKLLQDKEYQPSKKSRKQSRAEAKRLIAEGYNIKDLINRIKKDKYAPTPTEIDILRDYFVSLTARINESPTPELLAERTDLLELIRDAGLRLGQSVQAFDGFIAIEDNLASFLDEESAYTELSKEEVTELSEKYNKAQEALKRLQEKEAEAIKKANDKKAQKNIDDIKKQRGSIKEDFKQERVKLREDLRDALRKARNTTQATFVPYANELIVASPIVKKLVASYVKEGIYDLKTIVQNIHDELKDDITDLTEDDVRDMIAGQYTNPKNTKNAKLAEIRDLETQARLEAKIEDLNNGILNTPKSQRKAKSDRIQELEKEIKEIKRRNPDLTYPSRLQGRKTWFTNRIKELKGEIAKGDFDPVEPPTPILLDAEALKLKDEYAKFKEETRERRQKKEREALNEWQKGLRVVKGLAGLRRAVNVSVDLSIPLRQGVAVMLNPRTAKIGADAYVKMVEAVKSRANYNRMMVDIERSPAYLESKDDGIVYNEVATSNTNDEWHQSNDILNKIPVLRDLVKGSEIAAAAWTNYARYELYKKGTERLLKEGKTRENSKEAYERMAARVMVDTGRGKIPFLKDKGAGETDSKIKQALSSTMFGPRLYSATFRKLNPLYYFNPKVDRTVRIEALKDMTGYVASQIALGLLVSAAGATVSLDYDDPDFLKARWGKKVVDLTAGQSVYIRTFLRLMTAAVKRADPSVNEADSKKYSEFAMKSVGSFWRNKLAPNTAYGFNAFMGENSIGEKFNPWEILKIYPMYTDDIIKSLKEGNPLDALITLPIGISGLGYQEYSKDLRKARVNTYVDSKDTKVKSFLKKNKLNITGDINQEVYDINTGDKVKMTKEQSDKYETIWAQEVIRGIKAEMPELDKLAEKDKKHEGEKGYEKKLNGAISKIKTQATDIAKETITGVPKEMFSIKRTDDNGDEKEYDLNKEQIKEMVKSYKEYLEAHKDELRVDIQASDRDGLSLEQATIKETKSLKSTAIKEAKDKIFDKGDLKEKE